MIDMIVGLADFQWLNSVYLKINITCHYKYLDPPVIKYWKIPKPDVRYRSPLSLVHPQDLWPLRVRQFAVKCAGHIQSLLKKLWVCQFNFSSQLSDVTESQWGYKYFKGSELACEELWGMTL